MAPKQEYDSLNQSAFSRVVSGLDGCTTDELRQLHAIISIRIGEQFSLTGSKSGSTSKVPGSKSGKPATPSGKTRKKKTGGKKGNPQRKSQWATNPSYQEYARLKKAVEAEAKELKISFNLVNSESKAAYDVAFAKWIEEKSSFRKPKEAETTSYGSGQENPETENEPDDEPMVQSSGSGSDDGSVTASSEEASGEATPKKRGTSTASLPSSGSNAPPRKGGKGKQKA